MSTTDPTTRPGRKAVHGYITDEAHDAWHHFATEQGVSVSALLEALGPMLGDKDTDPWDAEMVRAVRMARKVDAANRRRRQ